MALAYDAAGDVATVTFPGPSGAHLADGQYRIHWSDDQATWFPLTSAGIPVVVTAAGASTSYSVPIADSALRRFFRVELLAP